MTGGPAHRVTDRPAHLRRPQFQLWTALTSDEGDYLALLNGKLFGTSPKEEDDAAQAGPARPTASPAQSSSPLFYGEDVTEEQAEAAEQVFAKACPDAEVAIVPGGQPVYYYLISIE